MSIGHQLARAADARDARFKEKLYALVRDWGRRPLSEIANAHECANELKALLDKYYD